MSGICAGSNPSRSRARAASAYFLLHVTSSNATALRGRFLRSSDVSLGKSEAASVACRNLRDAHLCRGRKLCPGSDKNNLRSFSYVTELCLRHVLIARFDSQGHAGLRKRYLPRRFFVSAPCRDHPRIKFWQLEMSRFWDSHFVERFFATEEFGNSQ